MKKSFLYLIGLLIIPTLGIAQNEPHYTMFMFDKLLFNPAYAGNADCLSANVDYRSQWVGIDGAPKTFSATIDAPVGNYMNGFRHVALGLSVTNEQLGVVNNTNLMAYYAYRIQLGKSVLSLGVQAGAALYSANYSNLNPYQQNDHQLTNNINNTALPNVGAGVYWSGDNYYLGASVPSLLQNYYDQNYKENNEEGRQQRAYYLSGGYVITLSDMFKLEPQAMLSYAANGDGYLPLTADLNLSAIFYDRLLIGATYRTDKSVEGIVHIQVTKRVNVGYAYDYSASVLQGYNTGSHEITLGFNFIKDLNKYANPRFVKLF